LEEARVRNDRARINKNAVVHAFFGAPNEYAILVWQEKAGSNLELV
jgi:hypothetical protein